MIVSLQKEKNHEYDHDERRHTDLLQGLGNGTARRLQPRLAALRGCLRRPDVLSLFPRITGASPMIAAVTAARASPGMATTWTPTPTILRRSRVADMNRVLQ